MTDQANLVTSPKVINLPTSHLQTLSETPAPESIKSQSITPPATHTRAPQNIIDIVNQRIASCVKTSQGGQPQYIKDEDIQTVWQTTREYLTLPNDIYPFNKLTYYGNNAHMGYISNGGEMPPIIYNNCWSVYYDFELLKGNVGSVDINIPSAKKGDPDFHAHINVTSH